MFMPPTLKKLFGHIALGACVQGCVRTCVTLFCTYCNFETVKARVLKFHKLIPHIKIGNSYFCLELAPILESWPFEKYLVNRISQEVFKLKA